MSFLTEVVNIERRKGRSEHLGPPASAGSVIVGERRCDWYSKGQRAN